MECTESSSIFNRIQYQNFWQTSVTDRSYSLIIIIIKSCISTSAKICQFLNHMPYTSLSKHPLIKQHKALLQNRQTEIRTTLYNVTTFFGLWNDDEQHIPANKEVPGQAGKIGHNYCGCEQYIHAMTAEQYHGILSLEAKRKCNRLLQANQDCESSNRLQTLPNSLEMKLPEAMVPYP